MNLIQCFVFTPLVRATRSKFALLLLMVFALAGCGSSSDNSQGSPAQGEETDANTQADQEFNDSGATDPETSAVADAPQETTAALEAEAAVQHHYYDIDGNPLPQWDYIWEKLFVFFGTATPDKIKVEFIEGGSSKFNASQNTILIGTDVSAGSLPEVVAHESAHVCLAHLTKDASTKNEFRFFDEGFASLVGYGIVGQAESYKKTALATAAVENLKEKVRFDFVQDWSQYYGDPSANPNDTNPAAYEVGASFDYLIIDTRGEKALHAFFVDIGETRDLEKTFENVFSATVEDIEGEWLEYLAKVPIDSLVPTVVETFPAHKATDVPVDTSELYAKFDTDMNTSIICVLTPCGSTNVCYTNAYWKNARELAVLVTGGLKPGYAYKLSLGSEAHGCALKSYAGVPLPYTDWYFTAAK